MLLNRTLQFILGTALITSAAIAAPGGNGVVPGIGWLDSYSVNGHCYIDSTFDHGIGDVIVPTPVGGQTVRQVARRLGPGPGRAGNPVYNDVQCGNGPANSAGDEDYDQCPGRVDQGAAGCSVIGPKWNLERVYGTSANSPSTTVESDSPPVSNAVSKAVACSATGPTLAAATGAFDLQCASFTREDCDPIYLDNVRVWMCANYRVETGSASAATPPPDQNVTNQLSLQPGRCDALGENLSAARQAYAATCSAPRLDCDPAGNGGEYRCASYTIQLSPIAEAPLAVVAAPAAAVVENPQPTAVESVAEIPALTTTASSSSGCDATGVDLSLAKSAYAAQCGLPRKDCDPFAGGYKCASYAMGSSQPASTNTSAAVDALPPLGDVSAYLDTFNQPYRDGDLLSLHWDSSNDPDDMQAMILTREILDSTGGTVDFMAVNGAKRVQNSGILNGSTAHMRTLFPAGFEAWRNGLNSRDQSQLYNNTVAAFATAWALTLASGDRVHVAEGGPSDFTASVIEELLRRGVVAVTLKNIRVVQHSWGANELWTTAAALNTVRRYASYIRIANGNAGNGEGPGHTATPDYELKTPGDPQCTLFRARALASQYYAQWQTAFDKIRNKCDGSDAVEVVWILGIPTHQAPTLDRFADRYF